MGPFSFFSSIIISTVICEFEDWRNEIVFFFPGDLFASLNFTYIYKKKENFSFYRKEKSKLKIKKWTVVKDNI